MSASIFGRARLFFGVMAVTAFSAMVLVGCGKKDDNPAGPSGGGGVDSKLVGSWALESVPGTEYLKFTNTQMLTMGVPVDCKTDGNKIYLGANGQFVADASYEYSFNTNGNLVLKELITNTSVTYVKIGAGPNPPPGGGTGSNLVLGANEAWVGTFTDEDGTMKVGYIFKENNIVVAIVEFEGLGWLGAQAVYSVSGNILTLTFDDPEEGPDTEVYTYSVSGNTLTLTADGETETFTKTGNITYLDMSGMMKSRADKKLPRLFSKNAR